MKTGQTATEFFQEFDLYALHADYMKNEEILICMAEKKIPKQLVHSMFNCGKPPTVYQTLLRVVFSLTKITSRANRPNPNIMGWMEAA